MTLNEMKPGNVAIITGYHTEEGTGDPETTRQYRAKLLALGLTRGTKVQVISTTSRGDSIEIDVRGAPLTLQKAEADILIVRQIQG